MLSDIDKKPGQMTLDVGGPPVDPAAIIGSLKISGALALEDELYRQDQVIITIADADGAVVPKGYGSVRGIGFKDHEETAKRPAFTERIHTIKLDA